MKNEQWESPIREALREEPCSAETPCPSLDELMGFIKKSLSSEERVRVDAHISRCHLCRADIARLYRAAKRQMVNAQLPMSNQQRWSLVIGHWSFRWGLAAAVAVLIAVLIWKFRSAPREE